MSDMTDLEGIRRQLAATIQAHWKLFLAQGILMMVLGFLAVAEPNVATVAVGIFVGWLFFVAAFSGHCSSGMRATRRVLFGPC